MKCLRKEKPVFTSPGVSMCFHTGHMRCDRTLSNIMGLKSSGISQLVCIDLYLAYLIQNIYSDKSTQYRRVKKVVSGCAFFFFPNKYII